MNTVYLSKYLMQNVDQAYGYASNSFHYPNISNLMTKLGRAFQWAGLLERKEMISSKRGKRFTYRWRIDVVKHKITKEQLEWAYHEIYNDPEFKKTIKQSKRLGKPLTAVDKMDNNAKDVLQQIMDENEQLKAQLTDSDKKTSEIIDHLQKANEALQRQLEEKQSLEQDDEGTGFDMTTVKDVVESVPSNGTKEAQPVTESPQPDPFDALDRLRGHLTRGSQVKIEIVL
jgi:hypothetical protein